MKHKQRGSSGIELIVSIALLAIILVIMTLIGIYQCGVQWQGSGLKSEYRIGAGCMVQKKDGRWLPAKTLRDTDI